MKRNENFWSYRLHKLGTPKVLRTDRRTDGRTDRRTDRQTDGRPDGHSGPTTIPAFAKATQVIMHFPKQLECKAALGIRVARSFQPSDN